jgi:hypothetical protein
MYNPEQKLNSKSDIESNKWRELGNTNYKENAILEGIVNFNKALCYAKSGQTRALAYANRAAAYLEIGKYKECLKSITLARESGYPAEKLEKLNQREEKCLQLMRTEAKARVKEDPDNPDIWSFFKLSYPANEKIPFIIDSLEMRRTEKFGRGIYTTRDLNCGDIISVEPVKIFGLVDDGHYRRCSNCFKINMLCLIPCQKTGKC